MKYGSDRVHETISLSDTPGELIDGVRNLQLGVVIDVESR